MEVGHIGEDLVSLTGQGSLAGAEDSCFGNLCTRFWIAGWGKSKGDFESWLKSFSVFPGRIRFIKEESSTNNDLGRSILLQEAEKTNSNESRQDRCACLCFANFVLYFCQCHYQCTECPVYTAHLNHCHPWRPSLGTIFTRTSLLAKTPPISITMKSSSPQSPLYII